MPTPMSRTADMSLIRCDRVDVLGKVPWRNEYVRPAAATAALTSFDSWMAESVDAATRGPSGWGPGYANGAMHAFVYRPSGAAGAEGMQLLAGAVTPSQDGAGRQYPVALAGTLVVPPRLGGAPEVLPLLLEEFWQSAIDLILEAKAAAPSHEEQLRKVQACFGFSVDEAMSAYAQWISHLTVGELWALLFGPRPARTPEATIEDVVAATAPFRGVEQPRTPLTLRLPLGAAAGAAVCFWVDLVRRAAAWRATIPSFFWSHDGSTGTMLLHLGDAPRSV